MISCGPLQIDNPCELDIHQELFGHIRNKSFLPNEKSLTNMLNHAFRQSDKRPEMIEKSFTTSLKAFLNTRHRSALFDSIPIKRIRKVFYSEYTAAPHPATFATQTPSPTSIELPIAPSVEAPTINTETSTNFYTRIFTMLGKGTTTITTHAKTAAQVLMKKEVLIPLVVTVGVIVIAAFAYKMLFQPIEKIHEKQPIQPPSITRPINPSTAARIATLFENAQRAQ